MIAAIKKIKWFFIEHKANYVIAIVSLMIVNVLVVIPPWLIGKALDDINNATMTTQSLQLYMLAFLGLTLGDFGFSFTWIYKLFNNSIILQRDLRTMLMKKFMRMTPTFYEKNNTGDLMAKATNDLTAISEMAGFGVLAFTDATTFMGVIIFMMGQFISWKLTLVSLIPLPFLAIGSKIIGDYIHTRYLDAQNAFGKMNDTVLEYIVGIRVVRSYVKERATENSFEAMTQEVFDKNMKVEYFSGSFMPSTKIITTLCYAISITYGAQLILDGSITLGNLISFNVYLNYLIWPMIAIGEFINTFQRGNASLDRVTETLDYQEDVQVLEEQFKLGGVTDITFDHYNFQYPKSMFPNLQDINLELKQGQTLGIVGKTGSGKTTLVKQLLKEYPTGEGSLLISGEDIGSINKDSLLTYIGYVPQDHILFSRSIRDNILFGREDAAPGEIMEAIRLSDFEKDLYQLPQGLDTMVGERGISISGGQKQRISIARAMIKMPEVLILDDSLSAVDAKTESRIIRNIRGHRAGKTTLITTHRLSAVQHADLIVVLEDGRIIERGSHEELMAQKGWYKSQFDIQQLEEVTA